MLTEIIPEILQFIADGKLKIETLNVPLKDVEKAWNMSIKEGKRLVILIE